MLHCGPSKLSLGCLGRQPMPPGPSLSQKHVLGSYNPKRLQCAEFGLYRCEIPR